MIAPILGSETADQLLVSYVKSGSCVLFLGAGVHAPPPDSESPWDYPEEKRPLLGGALVQKLAKDCDFERYVPANDPWDLQRVSLCYETTQGLSRSILIDALSHHLDEGKEPSPALRMLARLPFKYIVTTNYDHLFERALEDCGKRPQRLIYDPHFNKRPPDLRFQPSSEQPLLFKIHGDLDERDSIVITEEDYINFVQRMSEKEKTHPVPSDVRKQLMSSRTLFIGYSLRDYNLRLLFRTLRWGVDPAYRPIRYAVDMRPDPLVLRVWQDQRQFVTFVIRDLWTFIPWLHNAVVGRDCPAAPDGDAI